MTVNTWMLEPFRERLGVVARYKAAGDIIKFLESHGAIEDQRVIAPRLEPALESVFGKQTAVMLKNIILKRSLRVDSKKMLRHAL